MCGRSLRFVWDPDLLLRGIMNMCVSSSELAIQVSAHAMQLLLEARDNGVRRVVHAADHGLLVPGRQSARGASIPVRHGQAYGQGAYTAKGPGFASGYAGDGTMLVCAASNAA